MNKSDQNKYWKTNLKYVAILLSIWFVVSYGFGIILVDELNSIRIGGFKLGFGLRNRVQFMYLLF